MLVVVFDMILLLSLIELLVVILLIVDKLVLDFLMIVFVLLMDVVLVVFGFEYVDRFSVIIVVMVKIGMFFMDLFLL